MSKTIIDNISIEEYIDFPNFDTGTFADDLARRTANSGIPSWVFQIFRDYLKTNYYGMYYTLIPLTVENDDNKSKYYMHNISKIICRTFFINKDIIRNIDEQTKGLINFSYEKLGDNSHTHTGVDTFSNKAMTETSPITSGANIDGSPNYTIDTPAGRSIGDNVSNFNSSYLDKIKESNPYYFTEFLRTIEKHNLYSIYDKAIRSVIKEFYEVF